MEKEFIVKVAILSQILRAVLPPKEPPVNPSSNKIKSHLKYLQQRHAKCVFIHCDILFDHVALKCKHKIAVENTLCSINSYMAIPFALRCFLNSEPAAVFVSALPLHAHYLLWSAPVSWRL